MRLNLALIQFFQLTLYYLLIMISFHPHTSSTMAADPHSRTSQPIVTGSSVIGIKYKGGVMLAADTLASYGSMARYKNFKRIVSANDNTLIGASGELSDFQSINDMIDQLHQEDVNMDDGYIRGPKEIYNYVRSVLYQRRCKGNPLWNQLLIGGCRNGQPFLGYVDLIGTSYEENFIATGYGSYLAIPLIREKWNPDLSEEDAKKLLEECLRVLFYRDCRASNRIMIAKATSEGITITEPYEISHNWETATYDARNPYSSDVTSW